MLNDEIIELEYHPEDENRIRNLKIKKNLRLRKVSYQNDKNRYFEFLTNNFDIETEEVAFLYKKRWGIELLFKKMKQNFQLHYFYGENIVRISIARSLFRNISLSAIPILIKLIPLNLKPINKPIYIQDVIDSLQKYASSLARDLKKPVDILSRNFYSFVLKSSLSF